MFKINDYVMYGTTGVCKIIDITKVNIMGNKVTKRDENIKYLAENMLNEEFAAALGILPNEVFDYIENHM